MRIRHFVVSFALLLCTAVASAQPSPTPPQPPRPPAPRDPAPAAAGPRYLAAMRTELEAMRLNAVCETVGPQRATCRYTLPGRQSAREFSVTAEYSDDTDTVYVYVERYLVARPDAAQTDRVLRRLMELNWTLLVGKLEWDPSDGEVRVAMILNTDSNFDRRAFRSIARGIGVIADRYYGELSRLAAAPAAGAAPAAPRAAPAPAAPAPGGGRAPAPTSP